MAQTVAIDIGGTSVKLGLVENEWRVGARAGFDTDREASFDSFCRQLFDAVGRLAPDGVDSLAISAPGAHDERGVVVAGGDNVPFLTRHSLPDALARRFGAKVLMENDGLCATAAELLFGAGRGRDRFVLATLGTGVGGAVILGGRILAGRGGIPPEFGELCLGPHGNGGGERLEEFGSATALLELYRRRRRDAAEGVAPADVLDRAQGGEKAACAAVDDMTDRLGQAFGILVNVLDLEAVVIGGGLSRAGSWLPGRIALAVRRYVHRAEDRAIAVVPAECGNDAGVLGAVAFARGRMRHRVQRGETPDDARRDRKREDSAASRG